MQMKEKLEKFKNLQDILAEKYDIESRVEELPKSLVTETDLLDRMKKEYIQKNTEYEDKKAEVENLRASLDSVTKLREESEKQMDNELTHREFEILDKQISDAQEQENSIRKNLQKREKEESELNDALEEKKDTIDMLEQELSEKQSAQSKNLEEFNAKLEELKQQEDEISNGIESQILIKFQRIIKRNRKGIVAVRSNVCEGCNMILPAQFANEVRKGEDILFCPYCSRILFYEESADNESAYTTADSGNLVGEDDEEDLLDDKEFEDEEMDSSDLNSSDYE